jgi:hypothetical protein
VHSGDFREGSVTGPNGETSTEVGKTSKEVVSADGTGHTSENFVHIEADSRAKKHSRKITASILTPFSELLPNVYYSPIKKLENKQRDALMYFLHTVQKVISHILKKNHLR